MPGFFDALMSLAVTAVVGLTAATQLYHAWRAIEEAATAAGAQQQHRRRRGRQTVNIDSALERALGLGGSGDAGPRLRAVRDGREIRILTPAGEAVLVFQGSAAAMEELGLIMGGDQGGGGNQGGGLDPAAARVAALAGTGREFGPDDYEALSALDAGIRQRHGGGGGRGARVRDADVARLPTHAHRCPVSASAGDDGGGGPPSCPVCLAPFEAGDCLRTLPCVHNFHTECVDPWLLSHGVGDAACPVCKTLVFSDGG